jgi:hypothetical protein
MKFTLEILNNMFFGSNGAILNVYQSISNPSYHFAGEKKTLKYAYSSYINNSQRVLRYHNPIPRKYSLAEPSPGKVSDHPLIQYYKENNVQTFNIPLSCRRL